MKRSGPPKRKTRLKQKRGTPRRRAAEAEPDYLAFVAQRQCIACGDPLTVAHHMEGERAHGGPKGGSMKAPDSTVVPLCWHHHREWHDRGAFLGASRAASIAIMQAARVRLRAAWAAKKGKAT